MPPQTETQRERRTRFLLVTSLAERKGFDPLQTGLMLVAIAATKAIGGTLLGFGNFFVQDGASIVALPLTIALGINSEKLIAARVIRKLRRVGRGFDVDRYLALLSKRYRRAHLVVRLRFEEAWPAERMPAIVDAMREWVPELETVRFDGDRVLYAQSKELATTERLQAQYSSGSTAFTNWPVHACFTAILRRAVPVLDASHRIGHIDVDVGGKVDDGHGDDD